MWYVDNRCDADDAVREDDTAPRTGEPPHHGPRHTTAAAPFPPLSVSSSIWSKPIRLNSVSSRSQRQGGHFQWHSRVVGLEIVQQDSGRGSQVGRRILPDRRPSRAHGTCRSAGGLRRHHTASQTDRAANFHQSFGGIICWAICWQAEAPAPLVRKVGRRFASQPSMSIRHK